MPTGVHAGNREFVEKIRPVSDDHYLGLISGKH